MTSSIVTGAMLLALVVAAPARAATFSESIDANGTNWRVHRFEVDAPGQVTASLNWTNASAQLNMFLYDAAGTKVASATGSARPKEIRYEATTGGTWKVGIRAKSGETSYSLTVNSASASAAVVQPSYVDTIGGGTSGHAEMYPSGLDVDGAGNVYVADTGDDQIQKYNGSGVRQWVVGTRGAKAPGRYENPRDVAFLQGKVYVADTGFNRVQVLDATDGSVLSVWSTKFATIMGISAGVNGAGSPVILAAESGTHSIKVFSPSGALLDTIGSGPGNGAGQLNGVRDAATDANGNIYAADYANSRVVVFGPLGGHIRSWGVNGTGPQQLKRPYGIDLDDAGRVYVADSNNYVHEFTQTGGFIASYGSPGEGAGRFRMLRRVAVGVGPSPSVYGADLWTFKIERFAQPPSGTVGVHVDVIGGRGPADGFFNEPYGLSLTPQDLFVVDMVNQRAQRFAASPPFSFELNWGGRGWGEGNPGFNWARDATIGSNGGIPSVWIADTKNNRLTEFRIDGTPTGRKFGTAGAGVGQFNWPHAVATIAGSELIVANTKNHRVERWNPSGPTVEWAATSADGQAFNAPKDVTVHNGDVYVLDTLNRRVVVLGGGGGFIRRFGGTALHNAEGIAVEPNGEVWVADTSWNRLIEYSPTGAVLQTFGGLGTTNAKFNKPAHLEIRTIADDVFLYVVDSWNDRVQVYDIG